MTSSGSWIAWWGAGLSTLLAGIKLWELWRDRFRVDVSYNFTTDTSIGNDILIRNLSNRPMIMVYWELLYGAGRWPGRKFEPLIGPDPDENDHRIEPHSTLTLNFSDSNYFSWNHNVLNGRKIYIRIHVAGRKPVLCLVYKQ